MVEPIRTEPATPGEPAVGSLRGACFGGLLEGRLGDRVALERAVRRLREEGPVDAGLEVEGARFSLYLDDAPVDPARAGPARMQVFLEALTDVLAASDAEGPLDSTLRCTEYYDDEVVETHIGIEDGAVAPVSRARARTSTDALPRVGSAVGGPLLDERPRRLLVALAGALLLGLVLWQGRVVDRIFGAAAEALTTDTGAFDELVELRLEPAWGGYRFRLSRGADYPRTGAAVQRLEESAATPLERAAVAAVADGGVLELRVVDAEGAILARDLVPTQALLVSEEAAVEGTLPARIGASALELALPLRRTAAGGPR